MDYLKIANWDRWQSFRKGRSQPPWIKIHRNLMRNYEWMDLTNEQRGQLVTIWLLGADKDGQIPADPGKIRQACQMDKEPDLQLFIDLGFIEDGVVLPSTGGEMPQPAAKCPPRDRDRDRGRDRDRDRDRDRGERETEGESEREKKPDPDTSLPFEQFYGAYPIHKGPTLAKTAWKKLSREDQLAAIGGIVSYQADCERTDTDFMYPQGYLNQRRWEDEAAPERANKKDRMAADPVGENPNTQAFTQEEIDKGKASSREMMAKAGLKVKEEK